MLYICIGAKTSQSIIFTYYDLQIINSSIKVRQKEYQKETDRMLISKQEDFTPLKSKLRKISEETECSENQASMQGIEDNVFRRNHSHREDLCRTNSYKIALRKSIYINWMGVGTPSYSFWNQAYSSFERSSTYHEGLNRKNSFLNEYNLDTNSIT